LAPSTNPVIRIKELSSLEDLLRQAGYKDTRVCTPEAEKTRKIKQTFEEEESEELNDLYGTFGLTRKQSHPLEHRIQNITEPTIPFRSSSAMLRDLALQDIRLADKELLSSSQQSESWWGGGMAALGRAAKAVIELSPPAKGLTVEYTGAQGLEEDASNRGSSIRKTQSNMELATSTPPRPRSIPQEQRPVASTRTSTPSRSPVKAAGSVAIDTPESIVTAFDQPPQAYDEDAFGYSPLPNNYETQCDEDDGSYQSFEVASLGSSTTSRMSSREMVEEDEMRDVDSMFGSRQPSHDLGTIGRRIMEGALEYDDEFDTPPKQSIALPFVEPDCTISEMVVEHEESPVPQVVEIPKKYADRATKLRIAKSTPVLKPTPPESSWFGSLRSVLSGAHATYQALPTEQPATSGALWISPTAALAPTLVTTSTVMCDSTSNAAVDLPPVVTRSANSGPVAAMSLRLRPSMARLREAVGVPAKPARDDTTPTLSPRLDWDEQGESYAGWNWSARKPKSTARETAMPATPPPKSPLHLKGSIDYTKSFFYKPMTPPQPGPSTRTTGEVRARRSIKSLRAALLLPVAPPPVPALPAQYAKNGNDTSTPVRDAATLQLQPPVLAIQSPGSWEAGLPPRQLILEGEEWDPREGGLPGDWGRKAIRRGGPKKLKKKSSKTAV
jgi:hypothetical protein